ncbi:C-type lectin domain family 7 member A-like, partial [Saccostrea cucullata]|uniref:C-type lectin domain family 7 member A-like n=1 Tax=Saccostrea cuccullata TaxID=36930 RepID=UPI002ED20832
MYPSSVFTIIVAVYDPVRPATTMNKQTLTTTAVYDPVCGPNWELEQRSQVCYLFYLHPATWSSARSFCRSIGGELLSINNLREYYYILGRLTGMRNSGSFWIGGYDESDKGGWAWSDGSPFSFFNFRR